MGHRKETIASAFRITIEAKRLLILLAQKRGVSMTAILELAIRKEAKESGLD